MSTSHATERAAMIREICRQVGKSYCADAIIAGSTTVAELRALAGLPPPPSPQEQREIFRALH